MSCAHKVAVAFLFFSLFSHSALSQGMGEQPPAPAAQPVDVTSDPDRLKAAKELIEVTGAKKQIELMLEVMKQGMSAGVSESGNQIAGNKVEEEFAAFTKRFAAYRDQMVEEFAGLYAARFSAEELRQISAFYRSGTGAKFIAAMPELMQQGAEIGQKYALMVVRELKAIEKNNGRQGR